MIEIVPFDPELMAMIEPRWPEAIGDQGHLRRAVAADHAEFSRIGLLDGVPVGAGGAIRLWPGVGLAWVLAGNVPSSVARDAVRACRAVLDSLQRPGGFHRLQADIRYGFFAAMRFARVLGFTEEGNGIMRAYGADKSDYIRFARVRL